MLQKLIILLVFILVTGCSVQPVAVIPAENEPSSTPKSVPEKQAYKPDPKKNTAQPSAAAAQLMEKAESSSDEGDYNGAMRYLERAQRISPRAPEVYLQMAGVRKALGQNGQARQLANKALSLVGDDESLQREAEAFIQQL